MSADELPEGTRKTYDLMVAKMMAEPGEPRGARLYVPAVDYDRWLALGWITGTEPTFVRDPRRLIPLGK